MRQKVPSKAAEIRIKMSDAHRKLGVEVVSHSDDGFDLLQLPLQLLLIHLPNQHEHIHSQTNTRLSMRNFKNIAIIVVCVKSNIFFL